MDWLNGKSMSIWGDAESSCGRNFMVVRTEIMEMWISRCEWFFKRLQGKTFKGLDHWLSAENKTQKKANKRSTF